MELRVGVKALIKNEQGEYLFLRRSPIKYPDLAEYWDIPGGRILGHETCEAGMKREVFEELGMRVATMSKLPIAVQDIFVNNGPHIMRLTYQVEADGEPRLSDEHEELVWMNRDMALGDKRQLDPYIREVLEDLS